MNGLDEFFSNTRGLRQPEIDWLLAQGVPALALAKDHGEIGFVIAASKVVFGDSHFDFADDDAEHGVAALIMVARDENGDVADLVAWRPRDQLIAPYLGAVSMLGQHNVGMPRLGEPLLVHPEPLNWLRAARDGVVVLNPQHAWAILADAGDLPGGERRAWPRLTRSPAAP